MSRRTKILVVLGLVVVLGLIFFWPRGGYRRDLEAYKRELIAKGEKLTLAELVPPPPPPDVHNGGPALLAIMRDLTGPTNLPGMMLRVAPGLAHVGRTNLSPNEMIGYEQNLSNAAKLRAVLIAPVFYLHATNDPDTNLGSPVFVHWLDTERLLVATAGQSLFASNFPEARGDLLAALDLARHFSTAPHAPPFWLRAYAIHDAFNLTWEALQSDAWSDPQLAELLDRWQGIDFFSNVPAGMALNRVDIMAYLAGLRNTASNSPPIISGNQAFFIPSVPSSNNRFLDEIMRSLATARAHMRFLQWKCSWSYEEELYDLRNIEAARELAQAAIGSGAYVSAWQAFDQQASNLDNSFAGRTNHFFLFAQGRSQRLGGPFAVPALAETGRRICVTAIALKRYRLQHGAYPQKLDDLVPEFLPSVPTDFMDGKPLRYRLRPDGDFLLYSVGLDGVDDGGDPRPDPGFSLGWPWDNWPYSRDIVWPRVVTPANLEEYRQKYGAVTNSP